MPWSRHLISSLVLASPATVQAHGFAQRYDLPVPLGLYISGAAATVLLSFVVIAFFLRPHREFGDYPRVNLLATRLGRLLAQPVLLLGLRMLSVAILLLVILAGLLGDPNPFKNIAPTTVWVVW